VSVSENDGRFAEFGALTDMLDCGVLLLDAGGRLEFANRRARDLLGVGKVGLTPTDVRERWAELAPQFRLDDNPLFLRRNRSIDIVVDGMPRLLRLEVGPVPAESRASASGRLVLLKNRLETDVLETEMLLASQMRGLAHLYRVLAHDVRAPLNAMQLSLELLADTVSGENLDLPKSDDPVRPDSDGRGARGARTRRYVGVLREELKRLNGLLQTMLEQKETFGAPLGRFDLREVINDIRALLAPQCQRQHVELDIALPDLPVLITGYPDRIKQALMNIAIRGVEGMPQGGAIAIALCANPDRVQVVFSDSGASLSGEVLEEAFSLLYSRPKSRQGAGMFTARLVAESHGGELQIEMRNPGTRIVFSVPQGHASPAQGSSEEL